MKDRMTAEEYRKIFVDKSPQKSKFKNKPIVIDGIRFQSKKEGERYAQNKLKILNGELLYQLLQVPFRLPGGKRYYCDFMEVYRDGRILFVDVKGARTKVYKLKKALVEALYPIKITEV